MTDDYYDLDDSGGDPIADLGNPEADLTEFSSRGPVHASLVAEVAAMRADRLEAEAARQAFARSESAALAADELPTLILGVSLQEQFADRIPSVNDEAFAAQLAQAQALGEKPRSEGGRNFEANALGVRDAKDQAAIDRMYSDRETDPLAVLEALRAERSEAVTYELKRNPARAEALGLVFDPAEKVFVPRTVLENDADELSAEAVSALQKAVAGLNYSIPPGYTQSAWRAVLQSYMFSDVAR